MSKKKAEDDGKKKKGKAVYIVGAIGVAGLLKGFVLGGGAPAAAVDEHGVPVTTTTAPGPIVTLEPITVNIAGGRFLKVGLGLQMAGDYAAGGGGHGAPDSDDPTKGFARALDLTILVFGGQTYETLVTPEGRSHAKEELLHQLEEAYHHEIEDVYFTDFVMQ